MATDNYDLLISMFGADIGAHIYEYVDPHKPAFNKVMADINYINARNDSAIRRFNAELLVCGDCDNINLCGMCRDMLHFVSDRTEYIGVATWNYNRGCHAITDGITDLSRREL